MFDPSQMTLGELSAVVRNVVLTITVSAFFVRAAWGIRGVYDSALSFMKDIRNHMKEMSEFNVDARTFMKTVTENHLKHIEQYTKALAEKQSAGK